LDASFLPENGAGADLAAEPIAAVVAAAGALAAEGLPASPFLASPLAPVAAVA